MLCLLFCFGSIFASETNGEVDSVADKKRIEILKLTKKIDTLELAMDLKYVKCMLGLLWLGIAMEYYCRYVSKDWRGYVEAVFLGAIFGLCPWKEALIAFREAKDLSRLKGKLQVDKASLLSVQNEQNHGEAEKLTS